MVNSKNCKEVGIAKSNWGWPKCILFHDQMHLVIQVCDVRSDAASFSHPDRRLVEETHAHVVVGLFLGLLLLFFLGGRGAATSAAGGGSSCDGTTATGRHRGELLGTLLEQLLEVLALEGIDNSLEAGVVGLNADRGKDGLDVLGRGVLVAAEGCEQVCCHVTHFLSPEDTKRVFAAEL